MIRVLLFLILLGGALGTNAQIKIYPKNPYEKYTTGLFRSDNAYALFPENDPSAASAFNVFQYMQARVRGLQIYGANTLTPAVIYRMGVPQFYLDEVRVTAQTLASVNMNDIAYIKVFRPPFAASFGSNGAIAVYTKEGEEEEE